MKIEVKRNKVKKETVFPEAVSTADLLDRIKKLEDRLAQLEKKTK
jgi:hypothetical protein